LLIGSLPGCDHIAHKPCLAIIKTMKKHANDRGQFSQAVGRKLLHVGSREARTNHVAKLVSAYSTQLVEMTLDVTCDLQR